MPPGGGGVPLYNVMAPQGGPPAASPRKQDFLEELLGHKSIRDRQKTEKCVGADRWQLAVASLFDVTHGSFARGQHCCEQHQDLHTTSTLGSLLSVHSTFSISLV